MRLNNPPKVRVIRIVADTEEEPQQVKRKGLILRQARPTRFKLKMPVKKRRMAFRLMNSSPRMESAADYMLRMRKTLKEPYVEVDDLVDDMHYAFYTYSVTRGSTCRVATGYQIKSESFVEDYHPSLDVENTAAELHNIEHWQSGSYNWLHVVIGRKVLSVQPTDHTTR